MKKRIILLIIMISAMFLISCEKKIESKQFFEYIDDNRIVSYKKDPIFIFEDLTVTGKIIIDKKIIKFKTKLESEDQLKKFFTLAKENNLYYFGKSKNNLLTYFKYSIFPLITIIMIFLSPFIIIIFVIKIILKYLQKKRN